MTNEEYINQHPEQFLDDIDKWLFTEFLIIGGCCSAEKCHEYSVARMVAEKLTDALIEKSCVKLKKLMYDNLMFQGRLHREEVIDNFVEDFKKYLELNI